MRAKEAAPEPLSHLLEPFVRVAAALGDGLALSMEVEARAPLPFGGNPVVGDEAPHSYSHRSRAGAK